jgi:hypothetical protein
MEESGREIDPDDLPPSLEWEAPVWELYQRLRTQWRVGPTGKAYGLDYNPAIALMQAAGWDIDIGLELLQVVEVGLLVPVDRPGQQL